MKSFGTVIRISHILANYFLRPFFAITNILFQCYVLGKVDVITNLITSFRYMHRRCNFLDNCPAFNYNMGRSVPGAEDTSYLGSSLMRAMLKEVTDFCNPEILKNWSCKPHQQVSEPK